MKKLIASSLVLAMLLTGCTNAGKEPLQSTNAQTPSETTAPITTSTEAPQTQATLTYTFNEFKLPASLGEPQPFINLKILQFDGDHILCLTEKTPNVENPSGEPDYECLGIYDINLDGSYEQIPQPFAIYNVKSIKKTKEGVFATYGSADQAENLGDYKNNYDIVTNLETGLEVSRMRFNTGNKFVKSGEELYLLYTYTDVNGSSPEEQQNNKLPEKAIYGLAKVKKDSLETVWEKEPTNSDGTKIQWLGDGSNKYAFITENMEANEGDAFIPLVHVIENGQVNQYVLPKDEVKSETSENSRLSIERIPIPLENGILYLYNMIDYEKNPKSPYLAKFYDYRTQQTHEVDGFAYRISNVIPIGRNSIMALVYTDSPDSHNEKRSVEIHQFDSDGNVLKVVKVAEIPDDVIYEPIISPNSANPNQVLINYSDGNVVSGVDQRDGIRNTHFAIIEVHED